MALAQAFAPAKTSRESHETADREGVVLRRSDRAPLATRLAGFALVAALHGVGLLLLWHYTPARDALVAAAPIFIDLLSPQKPTEETKPPQPPKPIVIIGMVLPWATRFCDGNVSCMKEAPSARGAASSRLPRVCCRL